MGGGLVGRTDYRLGVPDSHIGPVNHIPRSRHSKIHGVHDARLSSCISHVVANRYLGIGEAACQVASCRRSACPGWCHLACLCNPCRDSRGPGPAGNQSIGLPGPIWEAGWPGHRCMRPLVLGVLGCRHGESAPEIRRGRGVPACDCRVVGCGTAVGRVHYATAVGRAHYATAVECTRTVGCSAAFLATSL